jgi:hypothetical protein
MTIYFPGFLFYEGFLTPNQVYTSMAISNFLGNLGDKIATSLGLKPKENPYKFPDRLNLLESQPQVINTGGELDFSERTPIFRDLGLQTRTVQEAASILMEAAPTFPGMSLFMDKYGFRSLNANVRDYSEAIRINLLNRAETLSLTNGLCNRALQVRTDLIVSEGFRVEADPTEDCPKHVKKAIQDVIDEHFELNSWTGADDRTYERVLDLQRTGESFRRLPSLFKRIGNSSKFRSGKFICGHISPHLVRGISIDPWNYEVLEKVYLEQYAFPNTGIEDLVLKIARDEKMAANEFGSICGDVLFSSLNRRPGCTRGVTDLAPAIDWLDIYDQMLLMDVERAQMMMRFIWDVTIEGATPQHILKYAETLKQSPPRPASIRVHNEKERWDAISPDLRLSDSKDLRDDIFLLAWGSMGLPRPWFTDGENSNRASIENMTDPNFAWARTRRRRFIGDLTLEHRYALQVAWDAGRFVSLIPVEKVHDWLRVKVVSRDPDRKGYESVGATWSDMANALSTMLSASLIDQQSAVEIISTVVGSYGFEINLENLKKIQNTTDMEQEQQVGGESPAPDEPSMIGSTGQQTGISPAAQMQMQESRRSGFRKISPRGVFKEGRKRGILGSSNPFDSFYNEAMTALKESQKNNRKMRSNF